MPDSINSTISSRPYASAWKLCALTCLAMVLLSLIPQMHLWLLRGKDWNGAYINSQGDEPLYSAYINALVEGRTRKNDPFGGRDDSPDNPLPESFFSIQFLPAYAIAWPTRALGVSVSTAFIVLIAVAALFATLSVFALINCLTGDQRLAAAGTLFVLCLGRFIGRYGLFGTFLDIGFPALPFLRRYQPAVAFPLFFVFQLLVYRALTSKTKRRAWLKAAAAGLILATLIFSYLYLWTTAVAWLICFAGLWFCFRSSERRRSMLVLTTVGGIASLALMPYLYLLSRRAIMGDEDLIVVLTHKPEFLTTHEILGSALLVALIIGVSRKSFGRTDSLFIFAVSLALLPFAVFNQQVVTGKTIQPFHYENFVISYSTLVGVVAVIALFWRSAPQRLLVWMASLAFAWGIVSTGLPAKLLFLTPAISNDLRVPVLRRLHELSRQDGTLADLRTKGQGSTLVFSPSVALIEQLPTWTSQATLLDLTGSYCQAQSLEERKESFFTHLYYSGVNSAALRKALNDNPEEFADALSGVRSVIFGHARVFPFLGSQYKEIQADEVEREVQAYDQYSNSFSHGQALQRPITYAIVSANSNFDFMNLDRWYERDAGERVGEYVLYRLKLRS